MSNTTQLPINELEATAATQVRVRIDPTTIDDYARDMKNGAIFPPMVVFAEQGSQRYILADGFHRKAGYEKAGIEEVEVQLEVGGMLEALRFALAANAQNGLRRSNADKVHAVQMALKDPELSQLSLREIGELCRVSHELVRNIKQEQNGTKPAKKVSTVDSKENGDDAVAPTLREPQSQGEVDLAELLAALKVIRAFPYNGAEAIVQMGLKKEHFPDLDYCGDWIDGAAAPLASGE